MELKLATRKKVKLRMGLSAVAGGGKTMSALLLAKGLCGDWGKIAVIDTENDSASLYSHIGAFNTISLHAPYSPERYIEAIKACEVGGMEVIIIDSIAHEWEGEGGVLDLCDKMGGGFQNGWKAMTPRHDKFKQAILHSTCHVITTVRRKQEYAIQEQTNRNGKVVQAPVKLGLKEITREGWEYEVTLNFEIDVKHQAIVSKDRTELFVNSDPFVISESTGELIRKWCDEGVDVEKERKDELAKVLKAIPKCKDVSALTALKQAQPSYIVSDASFIEAGKKRYEVIMATKPESETASTTQP